MTSADSGQARHVPLSSGDRVGTDDGNQWLVERHVAEGGFSSVYSVRPATPQTAARHGDALRALKCLHATPAEIVQISSESEKIAAVEGHENVLGMLASVELAGDDRGGLVGLVLELAAEDLYGFARAMHPDERAWAGVFEQVAAGLEHIHARGMIHGDIKPTNVLRVGPTFKIADFGVSRPVDESAANAAAAARTLAYLPPESCEPAGETAAPAKWAPSPASDVWALAVAMHRMLSGRHITAGITAEQQYELVCAGRYSIDDRLPSGWRALFADCLAHRPQRRTITTAAELRRRLADLAIPEDYVGVPWLPGAPRIVAVLQGADAAGRLILYLTRPGGRVQSVFVAPDVLLDVARHLHETAVPALAQQVRDAARAASRAAEERDRLQAELARLAAGGPDTEIVDAAAPTAQIQRLSSEVTTVIRQRDELTRERDRLSLEHTALIRQVEQLQQELTRRQAVASAQVEAAGYYAPYEQPPSGRAQARTAVGCALIVGLALVIALSIGLLVASAIIDQAPAELIERIGNRVGDVFGGSNG